MLNNLGTSKIPVSLWHLYALIKFVCTLGTNPIHEQFHDLLSVIGEQNFRGPFRTCEDVYRCL